MKRKFIFIGAVALLLALGLWFFVFSGGEKQTVQGTIREAQRADLEEVVTSLGKLEPATYVDVGAQVSGQIIKLHVELGDIVKKGDLLAEVDPRTFETAVDADKASLAKLEAQYAEAKANLVQAERNYKRNTSLRKQNAASELDTQQSETTYKVTKAQVKGIEAQIQQAKATLENDLLNLSYCKIYATMGGTVVSLEVKEGQTLNNKQAAPTLLRIAELEVMTVWASVSEADITKLRPGMDVYFTTIGDPTTRHYAKVEKIHPSYTEDNDVILYDVTFNIDNKDKLFLPAMNTQVFFVLAQAKGVLAIPLEVIPEAQRNSNRVHLNVLNADGKEERREVLLGAKTRTMVEVTSGLTEGEKIVQAPVAAKGMRRMPGARL